MPQQLFYVRIAVKDDAGNITQKYFRDDVIAANAEAAKAVAIQKVLKDNPDADTSHFVLLVSTVSFPV